MRKKRLNNSFLLFKRTLQETLFSVLKDLIRLKVEYFLFDDQLLKPDCFGLTET